MATCRSAGDPHLGGGPETGEGGTKARGGHRTTHNPLYGSLVAAAPPTTRILPIGRPSTNVWQMGSFENPSNHKTRRNLTRTRGAAGASRPGPGPRGRRGPDPRAPRVHVRAAGGRAGRRGRRDALRHRGRRLPWGLRRRGGRRLAPRALRVPEPRRRRLGRSRRASGRRSCAGKPVRVSLRVGTSTAIAGPAVEPDVHPTVGAGVRVGRRFGVLAEVDREGVHALARGAVRRLVRVAEHGAARLTGILATVPALAPWIHCLDDRLLT